MDAMLSKWKQLLFEARQTPKIENLKPKDISNFIDLILGNESTLEVTEKLAGRHVDVRITAEGEILGTTKGKGSYFVLPPDLGNPLAPLLKNAQEREFSFEILEPKSRPDYVHYMIDKRIFAELSGELTQQEAQALSTDNITFLAKDDLLVKDFGLTDNQRSILLNFQKELTSKVSVLRKQQMSKQIASIILSPNVKSIFGGAMEGFFVTGASKNFKVPSPSYAKVQKIQAPLYAVWTGRGGISKRELRNRFLSGGYKDRVVKDVVKYLYAVMKGFPSGYKSFFSPEEARDLLAMLKDPPERKTAYKVISGRINDRQNWYVFGGN